MDTASSALGSPSRKSVAPVSPAEFSTTEFPGLLTGSQKIIVVRIKGETTSYCGHIIFSRGHFLFVAKDGSWHPLAENERLDTKLGFSILSSVKRGSIKISSTEGNSFLCEPSGVSAKDLENLGGSGGLLQRYRTPILAVLTLGGVMALASQSDGCRCGEDDATNPTTQSETYHE